MNSQAWRYAQDHPLPDDYLYGDMTKEKYDILSFLYAFHGPREFIDWRMDVRATQEYMNRYDMDWSDIHDFRKLKSFNSQSTIIGSAYRMVSKNVEDLYR